MLMYVSWQRRVAVAGLAGVDGIQESGVQLAKEAREASCADRAAGYLEVVEVVVGKEG